MSLSLIPEKDLPRLQLGASLGQIYIDVVTNYIALPVQTPSPNRIECNQCFFFLSFLPAARDHNNLDSDSECVREFAG